MSYSKTSWVPPDSKKKETVTGSRQKESKSVGVRKPEQLFDEELIDRLSPIELPGQRGVGTIESKGNTIPR